MARLFVAAWPPAPVLDLLEELPRVEREGVRWTRREQWHVTLRFLGDVEVDQAVAALGQLDASRAAAWMGPTTEVLGRTVLMAPVRGLERLAGAVVTCTGEVGEPPERGRFRGHVTLARAKHPRALRGLAGEACEAEWRVDDVALVRSITHPDGAQYETLAVFPLR